MLKKILRLLKKFVVSAFILYSYNLIGTSLNSIIPINFITLSAITVFGIPSLFALIAILFIAY